MAATETQTYAYEPVSKELETRVLMLHSGQFDDGIRLCLDKLDLSVPADELLEYEALSYTWGLLDKDNHHTVTILASDGHPRGILLITESLNIALRHLRSREKARLLWVDILSINQSDLIERSHQVQWMDDMRRECKIAHTSAPGLIFEVRCEELQWDICTSRSQLKSRSYRMNLFIGAYARIRIKTDCILIRRIGL